MRVQIETSRLASVTHWQIKSALKWIDPSHLDGLDRVRVIETCQKDRHGYQFEPYLRGYLYNGYYAYCDSGEAEIVLYRQDIHYGIPDLFMFTPLSVLKVADHLAHEVGHHLQHRQSRPKMKYKPLTNNPNKQSEESADAYARKVVTEMLRHPVYKISNRVNTALSNLYYRAGLADCSDGDFQAGAKRFFFAYMMNMANEKAGQAYRHTMEDLRVQSPSPLSDAEKHWLDTYYNPYIAETGRPKRRKGERN